MQEATAARRVRDAVVAGLKAALGTIWFLLRIILPTTLVVAILEWSGILAALASFIAPAMGLIGLPGEASLVLLSSFLLNIYSAIAVAGTMGLDLRAATILAFMCLSAHNLIIETAVMRKTGSSPLKMVLLRLLVAVGGGLLLDLLLPGSLAAAGAAPAAAAARPELLAALGAWALSTLRLTLKIVLIVLALMVAQKLLAEFKVMDLLARLFAPLMALFGLPAGASFLWIVINVVGYAYGAGIVVKEIEEGKMKRQEGDLLNHHAAVSHSLVEDTALYVAVGVPLFWITVPRLVLALVVVWFERFRRHFFRRSFRAGVA